MWLSKKEWNKVEKQKKVKFGLWKALVMVVLLFVVINLMFIICCKVYRETNEKTEFYTLRIEDKIIDVEYDGLFGSKEYYYFLLEDYGMFSVSLDVYNSYMIGDMYEFSISYIPSK